VKAVRSRVSEGSSTRSPHAGPTGADAPVTDGIGSAAGLVMSS
jgi:hypothetical protein